jgi:hypothetical protein
MFPLSGFGFIMPLKAEFYQSRGKIARGVSNPVLAAKAQLLRTFAAGKIEIKRFLIGSLVNFIS